MTHTYAILEISQAAFDEIKSKLEEADYSDQFHQDGERTVIDMHGIAVASSEQSESAAGIEAAASAQE